MDTKAIILRVLLCLSLGQAAFGQTQLRGTAMDQVIVFRAGQDAIRGKLAEIGNEHIVLLLSEHEVTVPFSEISRIILSHERGAMRGMLYGAVLAGYASTYIFTTQQDNGGFVESKDLSLHLLVALPSIALGAGTGYLIDQTSRQSQEIFDFTGADQAKKEERSRLLSAANHDSRESKVHITFQGSHIYSTVPNLVVPGSYNNDYGTISKFNWLRKIQATYSMMPEAEIGLAVVWFGEPSQSSYGYEDLGNGNFTSYNGSQSFEANGKYFVASYKPLYNELGSRFDLIIGGGVGIASIHYSRTTLVSSITQGGPVVQLNSSFDILHNSLVGYLFGEFDFEIVEGLSLGLVADKVFAPAQNTQAVPEANISAQALPVGNISVGFTVGLHF